MKNIALIMLFLCSQAYAFDEGVSSWGMGFGLGVEQYDDKYIHSASIRGDDRVVVVEKTYDTLPSAWLTLNWNIFDAPFFQRTQGSVDAKIGMFAGVKVIDSNAESFSGFSLGPQISFDTGTRIINLGVGWVTHSTRNFANEISAGEPLPNQFDDIVYEEGTENSFMFMMSVNIL